MMKLIIVAELALLVVAAVLVAWTDPLSEVGARTNDTMDLLAPVARADVTPPASSAEETKDSAVHETIVLLARQHRSALDPERLFVLAETIDREAATAGVDPLLVAAIVATESSFRTRVVSHAGAVGLMQLRPWVARDVARRSDLEWNGFDTLTHPENNVRLGIRYYGELVERFDGDERLALIAYNRGPTRVTRQMSRNGYLPSRYADRVLGLYEDLSARTRDDAGSAG
jgi:soluble lytic murein transglycosylase